MSWGEEVQAVAMSVSVLVSILVQIAWLYLAWRFLNWLLYERVGIERNPAGSLKYSLRRLMCRHRRGYAHVRDGYGRNYVACAFCGADVNAGRRSEDRV